MTIKFGDYVRTSRHGYSGRVYSCQYMTHEDKEWVKAQSIRPSKAELKEVWVGILTNGGGSILTPMSCCTIIPPIKNFKHPCAKEYFK